MTGDVPEFDSTGSSLREYLRNGMLDVHKDSGANEQDINISERACPAKYYTDDD